MCEGDAYITTGETLEQTSSWPSNIETRWTDRLWVSRLANGTFEEPTSSEDCRIDRSRWTIRVQPGNEYYQHRERRPMVAGILQV